MAASRRHKFPLLTIAFEAALGLLGGVIAWLAGVPLLAKLWPAPFVGRALLVGLIGTLPLLGLLVVLVRTRHSAFIELLRKVRGLLRVLLAGARGWHIVAIALAAGFGEEILFRGALQPLAVGWMGPITGLFTTSLLFGLVHAATPTYFLFATLVSCYLGGLALATGEILSASIAHALYDYIAILYLLRVPRSLPVVPPLVRETIDTSP